MRLSRRKWTLYGITLFSVCTTMILLMELQTEHEQINPMIYSFNFNISHFVSSLFGKRISSDSSILENYGKIEKFLINDFRFHFHSTDDRDRGKSQKQIRERKRHQNRKGYFDRRRIEDRERNCVRETFVFLIKSAKRNFENRKIIRKYFNQYKNKTNISFQWYFFVGLEEIQPSRKDLKVEKDLEENSDLIEVNFIDNYLNNTLKLMSEIYWMRNHLCDEESLKQRFVFIDDDVFVNIREMRELLSSMYEKEAIFGHANTQATPFRWWWSKWYISREDYSKDTYPPYVSGSTVVMNRETLIKISAIIPYIKYFPFDDVYLGIIANMIGISVINENRIRVDYKCGIFCYESVEKSIAIHVPGYLSKLEELYEKSLSVL